MLIKANPSKAGWVNAGICCGKGKWGFDTAVLEGKQVDPLIKDGDDFRMTDYHEAVVMAAKKLEAVKVRHGIDSIAVAISDRYTNEEAYAMKKFARVVGAKTFCFNTRANALTEILDGIDSIAVAISDRYTNEEAYAMKKFARVVGAKTFCFNTRANALTEILGLDASPNTIDELLSAEVIFVPGFIKKNNPVIWNKIKQAAEAGAKVIALNTPETQTAYPFADRVIDTDNSTAFLKSMAKALIDMGKTSDAEGFDAFAASVADAPLCDECRGAAEMYANAKKAMIVFQQNVLSVEAAELLAEIALLSGHIGKPRDGILEVKAKNNSQGLEDMGIRAGAESLEGVKGLIVFGEDPAAAGYDLSGLEFLMVSDIYLTETAQKADVFIPGTGFASTDGTYTNTERRLLPVEAAICEDVDFSNWEIAAELAHVFEEEFGFEDEADISWEMDDTLPLYKYAEVGEILGGVLSPVNPKFVPAKDAKMVDELPCTDALMNMMKERLPEAVEVGEILGGVLSPVNPKFVPAKDAKMVDELPCTDALMNMMKERLPEAVPATR